MAEGNDLAKHNRLYILYLAVALDLFAVGLVVPLLPFYASALGADSKTYGLLGTIYGLAQLVGSPLMGRISDTYGRKAALLASCVGSGIGYFGIGAATSVLMLALSRIPVGFVKQTMTVSKAYVSDVSETRDRARGLGLISTAASIGFIIGPIVGGLLSTISLQVPALVSAAIFALDFLFILWLLPESSKPRTNSTTAVDQRHQRVKRPLNFSTLMHTFGLPLVGSLLIVHCMFSFSFVIFRSSFALYTKDRFGLDPKMNGYILSYIGVLDVITQSAVLSYLTRRFTENQLIMGSVSVAALSYVGIALAGSIPSFVVCLIPFVLGSAITNTCIISSITKLVAQEDIGVTLGISDSLSSMGSILGPLIGGVLMESLGTAGAPLVSAGLTALLSIYMWIRLDLTSLKDHST